MRVTWVIEKMSMVSIVRKVSIARQRASTFVGSRVNFGTQRLKFILWSCIHCTMIGVEKIVEKLGKK